MFARLSFGVRVNRTGSLCSDKSEYKILFIKIFNLIFYPNSHHSDKMCGWKSYDSTTKKAAPPTPTRGGGRWRWGVHVKVFFVHFSPTSIPPSPPYSRFPSPLPVATTGVA